MYRTSKEAISEQRAAVVMASKATVFLARCLMLPRSSW